MAQSNFQDVVVLNQDTLSVLGERIQLGSDAGSKSIVFAQDPAAASAIHLAAKNATGQETIVIPDANGTIGLITAISAGTTLFSNGQIVFSNSNNISFGLNGSTITASIATGTGLVGIAAGTQTATSGTVIFSNSNGLSFGMAGSLTITATADYVRSISAGTTNATGNQIVFSNSNGVSFGANGATITASVAAGGTPVNALGVSTGGNTLGNTGTTNGTIVFAGVGNITLSQSTAAGSQATISISGAANRVTAFSQWGEFDTNYSISNASLSMQKVSLPMNISATAGVVMLALAGNSGSSGALTISMGIYTLTGSTASLASSGSRQISWTSGSDTTASSLYGGASGTRYRTFAINASMTPGDYMFGFWFQTTNDGTWRHFGRQGVNVVGTYDGVETKYFLDGASASSFTTAMPASYNVTDSNNYVRTGVNAFQQPGVILLGTN